MRIGEDFQVVSPEMWRMLVRHFSFAEVQKHRKGDKLEGEQRPILPLVRSYEKIGMGIRTQLEFFYPQFKVLFVSACPEQLQPVSLCSKSKPPVAGLFEVTDFPMIGGKQRDSIGPQRFRFYSTELRIQFSAKRSIDQLKSHLLMYLRDVL